MKYQKDKYTNKHFFQDLILHRVHEILLVASSYDAFVLEEDGGLTEQILHEYIGMSLINAPRLWRAETAADAIRMMEETQFDLVLVMMRILDMDPLSIAKQIKKMKENVPVILLAFDESELKQLPDNLKETAIDQVYIWSGDSSVFLAIVKQIEDRINIARDVEIGNVRCIILIEDKPRYYSTILPLVYKEITRNIKQLMDKSLTNAERLLHMRARPKILLATNFEDAQDFFTKYQRNTLGIITDINFPKNGIQDPQAGQSFVRWARERDPSIPILLQSTYKINAKLAKELHVSFIQKQSKTLLQELRKFITTNFGFGDFIFKTPEGKIIDRVTNLEGLRKALAHITIESLQYHAGSNHFSNWLAARGEFLLASKIRPINYQDFQNPEDHRQILIKLVDEALSIKKDALVVEFSPDQIGSHKNFMRITPGSLGGKARGIAFANFLLNESSIQNDFPDIKIHIPRSYVIATTEFDRFIAENELWDKAISARTNQQVDKLFLKAKLSEEVQNALQIIVEQIDSPVAIRSSSLLEDSQYQPLSGAYATYMLPNSSKNKKVRFNQISSAVKRVYASMFYKEAMALVDTSIHSHEEEKMAVIIMELIGQKFENRFYPTFSGTVQSFNFYPVSYMKREEGVAFVAVGLGRTVAEREKSLRFSPKYPAILPQYYSIKATLDNSQNTFYALNISKNSRTLLNSEIKNLDVFDLKTVENDGMLTWMGSVVSAEDNVVRDSLKYKGTRIITFAPILKYNLFPLAEILNKLLALGKSAMGCEIEMEFAVNLYKDRNPEFCILQIKPMVLGFVEDVVHVIDDADEHTLCKSTLTLGNGLISEIYNIIMVDRNLFNAGQTETIAKEIERITREMKSTDPYILIGPGRWGTADPWLGIPVKWQQISGAKVIVEIGLPDFPVDPSFGSHFFQNVTSKRLGYFTVDHKSKTDFLDTLWLDQQRVVKKLNYTRWIQTEKPMTVLINGKSGEGKIIKPIPVLLEEMNEEETTGI